MNILVSELPRDIRAVLDRERALPAVSAATRSRALSRARTATSAPIHHPLAPTGRLPLRWAVATSLVTLGASIAVGAISYDVRAVLARRSVEAPQSPLPLESPMEESTLAQEPAALELSAEVVTPSASGVSHHQEVGLVGQELRVLRLARASVARAEFGTALSLTEEHARRFRNGRFVEEREALRVRALSGLGRAHEARRAAAAFQARFPRSVLLPAVGEMPRSQMLPSAP